MTMTTQRGAAGPQRRVKTPPHAGAKPLLCAWRKPRRHNWCRHRLPDGAFGHVCWPGIAQTDGSLPWRETDDPYHILVSEVMLQQTQVDRVLPKYHEWLSKYPTLSSLAAAPEADVSTAWRPLGYNIRPRRLQWIAREAVANFGGSLPSDEQTLLSFKGLGRYTVGAIRSFAFRQRAAILDTNVARVLFRVFVAKGDPKAHATIRHLWACRRRWCRTNTSSTSTRR